MVRPCLASQEEEGEVICHPILHALTTLLEDDSPTVDQDHCEIRAIPLVPLVTRWSILLMHHHPMALVRMLVHCPVIPPEILPWVVAR